MITVAAPLKRTDFQTITFGTRNYTAVSETGAPLATSSPQVDEILIANSSDGDPNQIDFIKRYNTWFVFTDIVQYPLVPYSLILIYYDRANRVAYTDTDLLKLVRKP